MSDIHNEICQPGQEHVSDEQTWTFYMEVTPTDDGRFFRASGQLRKPTSRIPIVISVASSTDLLFEKLEGEMKNALRQMVNDINQQVITPARLARRGK